MTLSGLVRRWPTQVWTTALLVLVPWSCRVALLDETGLDLAAADVHGLISDLFFAGLLSAVATPALGKLPVRMRGWFIACVFAVWTVSNLANMEHVRALGAPLRFTYAGYATDQAFLTGSVFGLFNLLLFAWSFGVTAAAFVLVRRIPFAALSLRPTAAFLLCVALINWSWAPDPLAASWRSSHFLQGIFASAAAPDAPEAATESESPQRVPEVPPEFHANFIPDLAGRRIEPTPNRPPNVLLIMLEGVSGANVTPVAKRHRIKQPDLMPKLSRLAQSSITVPTFLANQRQTNRGEFALLCGQLPRLRSGTSKMTSYAVDGGADCLPAVLAAAGYSTTYLQPAPLSFMLKDHFMSRAGFEDVRGAEFFVDGYQRSGWGIDDRAFFEQAAKVLRKKNQEPSPWFATLLTVGTHHPYVVPDDYLANEEMPGRHRALRYLDDAFADFLVSLSEDGLLDETLVLITSDESSGLEGYDDLTRSLSYNWGVLLVGTPDRSRRVVDAPFAQADLALSVLDYLGREADARRFSGRSIFRSYSTDRALAFANTYLRRAFWLHGDEIVMCEEVAENCQRLQHDAAPVFGSERAVQAAPADVPEIMKALTREAEGTTARSFSGAMDLVDTGAQTKPVGPPAPSLMFGGQYLTLETDQEIAVSLGVEVEGDATVFLTTDVYADAVRLAPPLPFLHDGDRAELEYVYSSEKRTDRLEVRLYARRLDGGDATIFIDPARLEIRKRTGPSPSHEVTRNEVRRAQEFESYTLGMDTGTFLRLDRCLKPNAVLRIEGRCRPGVMVGGPDIHVAAGSRVRAFFVVQALTGSGNLVLELVSGGGERVLKASKKKRARMKARTHFFVSFEADQDYEDFGLQLRVLDTDGANLQVNAGMLEVWPPEYTRGG